MKERFRFRVNGLEIDAEFDRRDIDGIYIPLLERLTALQREKNRRIFAFLAAPPAAGKSTLCLFLERLSEKTPGVTPLQCAGIDGFHYPNAYLETHFAENGEALSRIKGAPETYDVEKLRRKLNGETLWPLYDRRIHEPVEDALELREDIVIVEGNWLLLDEAPWNALECDYSVFLRADSPALPERVVRRKMAGGWDEARAREFVMHNDVPNIRRCLEHSKKADLNLAVRQDGTLEVII